MSTDFIQWSPQFWLASAGFCWAGIELCGLYMKSLVMLPRKLNSWHVVSMMMGSRPTLRLLAESLWCCVARCPQNCVWVALKMASGALRSQQRPSPGCTGAKLYELVSSGGSVMSVCGLFNALLIAIASCSVTSVHGRDALLHLHSKVRSQ